MSTYDTARPYLAITIILRDGNKAAFVLRSNTDYMNDHYGLIGGKVEKNESFTAAAIREAKEEAGVTVKYEDLRFVISGYRHPDDDDTDWVDIIFEVTKWQGETYNAEPHMHSKLEWIDLDHLPDNLTPGSKFYLEQIAQGNSYAELGWDE